MGHLRVTMGHLRVTIGHLRVTVGYLRVTVGHINSLLPVGRYIHMAPLPHRVAYILDLVHLIWTILFLLNLC